MGADSKNLRHGKEGHLSDRNTKKNVQVKTKLNVIKTGRELPRTSLRDMRIFIWAVSNGGQVFSKDRSGEKLKGRYGRKVWGGGKRLTRVTRIQVLNYKKLGCGGTN